MARVTTRYKDKRDKGNWSNFYSAVAKFRADGYKEIGSGSRAVVFQHPTKPDRVIKVGKYDGREPEGRYIPRDGWLEYVKSFGKSRSKHVPKVYKVDLFQGHYEAELEKLRETKAGDIPTRSMDRFMDRLETRRKTLNGRQWAKDLDDIWKDFHGGNFMVRPSTGDIVLTDPWFI